MCVYARLGESLLNSIITELRASDAQAQQTLDMVEQQRTQYLALAGHPKQYTVHIIVLFSFFLVFFAFVTSKEESCTSDCDSDLLIMIIMHCLQSC